MRPSRAGMDFERIVPGVSLAAAVAMGAWLWLGLPHPGCPMKALLGLPCVTCGMTRATIAAVHGHWGEALGWNPGVTAALVAALLVNGYCVLVLTGVLQPWRPRMSCRAGGAMRMGAVAAILLNWAYVVWAGV